MVAVPAPERRRYKNNGNKVRDRRSKAPKVDFIHKTMFRKRWGKAIFFDFRKKACAVSGANAAEDRFRIKIFRIKISKTEENFVKTFQNSVEKTENGFFFGRKC